MRHIKKRSEYGHHLTQANENPPQNHQNATSRWGSFGHKPQLLKLLIEEQYSLCCYSEVRADELILGYHIEHIENKKLNPQRTFDALNLAASAISDINITKLSSSPSPTGLQATFGGHALGKQKSVDVAQFISPHDEGCFRFFTYLSDGRIMPSHDLTPQERERATYTIELLNLNSPFLVVERKNWWEELDELCEDHNDEHSDILFLIKIYLVPCQGKAYPFFSLARSYFGNLSEKVLAEFAPELL